MSRDPYIVRPTTTAIDLVVQAGDPFDLIIPIQDDNDQAVELSEDQAALWLARATVRRNALSTVALHEWTTAGDFPNAVIVPGSEAAVQLTATAVETAAWAEWPSWHCGWDLAITPPDSPVLPHRFAAGLFRLLPEYTR